MFWPFKSSNRTNFEAQTGRYKKRAEKHRRACKQSKTVPVLKYCNDDKYRDLKLTTYATKVVSITH